MKALAKERPKPNSGLTRNRIKLTDIVDISALMPTAHSCPSNPSFPPTLARSNLHHSAYSRHETNSSGLKACNCCVIHHGILYDILQRVSHLDRMGRLSNWYIHVSDQCLLHNKFYKQDMQLTLLVHSENCRYRRRCRSRPCESQSRSPLLLLLSLRPKREMRFMIVAGTTSIRPYVLHPILRHHPLSHHHVFSPWWLPSYRFSDIMSKIKLQSDAFSILSPSFPSRS